VVTTAKHEIIERRRRTSEIGMAVGSLDDMDDAIGDERPKLADGQSIATGYRWTGG